MGADAEVFFSVEAVHPGVDAKIKSEYHSNISPLYVEVFLHDDEAASTTVTAPRAVHTSFLALFVTG